MSTIGDPIFALFIGLSAAATRINREEKELGHTTKQTIDAGFRPCVILRLLFGIYNGILCWVMEFGMVKSANHTATLLRVGWMFVDSHSLRT
ncbi:hypothetical protein DH86_00003962 [Scytalidium sp. 3C]|nr:hypothetical protein DH86_00003962 [Scytalidium sp. 3C]